MNRQNHRKPRLGWAQRVCPRFCLAILVTLATAPAAEATPKPSGSAGKRPLNALADATSPYLLQHAHNSVDWHPWGPEAFALARERDLPISLSVGYSACYWCHVMPE